MENENLCLITSVINTPNLPLSYSKIRSSFSAKERFDQTKKTIETIKKYIPNCKIILVECSFLPEDFSFYFENNTDYFLNLYGDKEIEDKVFSKSKSWGEGIMTIKSLEFISSNNIKFNNLFKISGRYFLNDEFKFSEWNNQLINCWKFSVESYSTVLYKIPNSLLHNFYEYLKSCNKKFDSCIGYEVIFADFVKSQNNKNINILGVEGYVSIDKSYFKR